MHANGGHEMDPDGDEDEDVGGEPADVETALGSRTYSSRHLRQNSKCASAVLEESTYCSGAACSVKGSLMGAGRFAAVGRDDEEDG